MRMPLGLNRKYGPIFCSSPEPAITRKTTNDLNPHQHSALQNSIYNEES